MPLLCLGGSFNPVHHGHLIGARAVAELRGYTGVLLIPNARPPHRANADLAPIEHRLAMCRLISQVDPFFQTSDVEAHLSGPGYTLDTVRRLRAVGMPKPAWLIGTDTLAQLPTWHEPMTLLSEVDFVVYERPGFEPGRISLPPAFEHLKRNVAAVPRIEISATDIRRRIAAGASIRYLTPEPVQRYIAEHGLYRT